MTCRLHRLSLGLSVGLCQRCSVVGTTFQHRFALH